LLRRSFNALTLAHSTLAGNRFRGNPSPAGRFHLSSLRRVATDPKDVDERIAEALAHLGLVVVDAVVNRQELAMPPAITAEMAKGFTLFMVKALLSRRGDEIVERAREPATVSAGAARVFYSTAIGFPGEPVAPTIGSGANT
jgi:hypothetical protein